MKEDLDNLIFLGEIKDGKLEFKNKSYFLGRIQNSKDCKVKVTVEPYRKLRSMPQNRLYWLYITQIADDTGNDKDTLHRLFSGKFLGDGIIEAFGEKAHKVKSTTSLTKSEFCEYMMDIYSLTGIPIPDTQAWELQGIYFK